MSSDGGTDAGGSASQAAGKNPAGGQSVGTSGGYEVAGFGPAPGEDQADFGEYGTMDYSDLGNDGTVSVEETITIPKVNALLADPTTIDVPDPTFKERLFGQRGYFTPGINPQAEMTPEVVSVAEALTGRPDTQSRGDWGEGNSSSVTPYLLREKEPEPAPTVVSVATPTPEPLTPYEHLKQKWAGNQFILAPITRKANV